jgi:cellobiose phosphorylase
MLAAILEGLRSIGLNDSAAWPLVTKVAFDSMPAQRRQLIELLADTDKPIKTSGAATALGLPTNTTRRALEDLAAHGVAIRQSGGEGKADLWLLDPGKRDEYTRATVPEMSETDTSTHTNNAYDDFSGKVS